ncbi:MAG: nucleotide exchange factor GrpE [Bdellovibrionales bacterium]|nr:nucleotide exchange factor GrpE [Bdellovibrionales bacterium]
MIAGVVDESASPKVTAEDNSEAIGKLQAELDKMKNEYLYLQAEFDNHKKRTIKERSDLIKYGAERVFAELLEVTDNFERALAHDLSSENVQSFVDGIKMIHGALMELLKKFGVEELPAEGENFNPLHHEALGADPRSDVPPGQIVKALKKPYRLHDKIIRPGQVIVSTEKPEKKEE